MSNYKYEFKGGECDDSEVGIYKGNDNPGKTFDEKVKNCARECTARKKKPFQGKWAGHQTKGFIVQPSGRCFCEDGNSKSCKRIKNSYKRYDFIKPFHYLFKGECSDSELGIYKGSDNPGKNPRERIEFCAKECSARTKKLFKGKWKGHRTKGFIVNPSSGRCFCEDGDSKTCKKVKNSYVRYDFDEIKLQKMRKAAKAVKKDGEKSLVNKGGTPSGTGKRLGECEGDCDGTTKDCKGSLVCFQRDKNEKVPGCKVGGKGDTKGYDYCYNPKKATKKTTKKATKKNPSKSLKALGGDPKVKLGECEGDCDSDNNCKSGLKCFQRNGSELVPGCKYGGSGDKGGWDYCIKKAAKKATKPKCDGCLLRGNCRSCSRYKRATKSKCEKNGGKWQLVGYSSCNAKRRVERFEEPFADTKCSYKDLTKLTPDQLLDGLFTDTENSPLYDDDEDNIITEYVDTKMDEFLESNEYYDDFLMKLCAVRGGKWINGSSFGKADSSFDRGSKCSYKRKKECDKSYKWSFIKKDIDPEKYKIPSQVRKLNTMLKRKNNDVKKLKRLLNKRKLFSKEVNDVVSAYNKLMSFGKKMKKAGQFDKLSEKIDKLSEKLDALETNLDLELEDNGEDDDYFKEEYKILNDLNDIGITDEMWKIEKIYNGETYAQFYKKYAGVKNICLQNDWAGSIRKSCEAYKQKIGGIDIKGCTGDDKPQGCVLRYNYDNHVCEPTGNYCNAFGLDQMIKNPPDKSYKVTIEDDKGKNYKVTAKAGGLYNCKESVGQKVMEAIFGTTLTRLGKKLVCPTCDKDYVRKHMRKGLTCKDYCCQNKECEQKWGDKKPICAFKVCKAKYGHNGPIIGACNALEEPENIWNKKDVKSAECGKDLFCKFPVSKCKWKNKVRKELESCDIHENCIAGRCLYNKRARKKLCKLLDKGDAIGAVQIGGHYESGCKTKWSFDGYCDFKDGTRDVGETCTHNNHCKKGNCLNREGGGRKDLGKCKLLDVGAAVGVAQIGGANGKKFGKACKTEWSWDGYCDFKDGTRKKGQSCGHNNHCKGSNKCTGLAPGSKNKHGKKIGKCGKADLGVYCRGHGECKSNTCWDWHCVPNRSDRVTNNGSKCFRNKECRSNKCSRNNTNKNAAKWSSGTCSKASQNRKNVTCDTRRSHRQRPDSCEYCEWGHTRSGANDWCCKPCENCKKGNKHYKRPFWTGCYKDEQCPGRKRDNCIRRDCKKKGLTYRSSNGWKDCGGWKFKGYCKGSCQR